MGRIKNFSKYAIKLTPTLDDTVIGSDSQNNGKTVNFRISDIQDVGDNKAKVVDFGSVTIPDENDLTNIADAINNLVNDGTDYKTVLEDEIPIFKGIITVGTNEPVTKKFLVEGSGKGVYGENGNLIVSESSLIQIFTEIVQKVPTLEEVLLEGNNSGASDIILDAGQELRLGNTNKRIYTSGGELQINSDQQFRLNVDNGVMYALYGSNQFTLQHTLLSKSLDLNFNDETFGFAGASSEGLFNWSNLTGTGRVWNVPDLSGNLIVDAPNDANSYVRSGGSWVLDPLQDLSSVLAQGSLALDGIRLGADLTFKQSIPTGLIMGSNVVNPYFNSIVLGTDIKDRTTNLFSGGNIIAGRLWNLSEGLNLRNNVFGFMGSMWDSTVGTTDTSITTSNPVVYASLGIGHKLDIYGGKFSGVIGQKHRNGASGNMVIGLNSVDLTQTIGTPFNNPSAYNPRFVVGNGTYNEETDEGIPSNALVVMSDGVVSAPSLSIANIDNPTVPMITGGIVSGINTGRLIDFDQHFRSEDNAISVGDIVVNITNNTKTTITSLITNETLGVLDASIFAPGESYRIFPQGFEDRVLTTREYIRNKLPYTVYTALITQVGPNVPTAVELHNTLGAKVSFTRIAEGIYELRSSSPVFTSNKITFSLQSSIHQNSGAPTTANIRGVSLPTTTTVATFWTSDIDDPTAMYNDDCLDSSMLEIRVYP